MNPAQEVKEPFRRLFAPGKSPSQGGFRAYSKLVSASVVVHAILFSAAHVIPAPQKMPVSSTTVKVTALTSTPTATPLPTPVIEKPTPQPTQAPVVRTPKPRVDKRVNAEPVPKDKPVEVRGGLSNSTALSNTGKGGLVVAEGNSSEVAVDPSKAGNPPPPPAATEIPNSETESLPIGQVPILESVADVPAKCLNIPEIPITDEAANAGISSGMISAEVSIDVAGKVSDVKIRKGLGFGLDQAVAEVLKKITCTPGRVAGKPVPIKKKRIEINVQF